ncbi:MAG TPA: VOC family protein [Propionibacteriaceae bacterium]|jgi:catechol 2,3-dioxygenase-like lactoylglutathione lyase family enzyme|nr:VOC family protein [Propionibacteriaceae bacterium]
MSSDSRPPGLRATSITIATSRPHDLAHFYARLLDLPVTADDPPVPGDPVRGGWAQVRPSGGSGMTLNFEYERYYTRPTWPSTEDGQNPTQHLDIEVDDLQAAVDRAVSLGATLADFQPQDDVRVLFDLDGHPFCLFVAAGSDQS